MTNTTEIEDVGQRIARTVVANDKFEKEIEKSAKKRRRVRITGILVAYYLLVWLLFAMSIAFGMLSIFFSTGVYTNILSSHSNNISVQSLPPLLLHQTLLQTLSRQTPAPVKSPSSALSQTYVRRLTDRESLC